MPLIIELQEGNLGLGMNPTPLKNHVILGWPPSSLMSTAGSILAVLIG